MNMKARLIKLFWPILRPFEAGDEPYGHKPINRKILIAIGTMFTLLSIASVALSRGIRDLGYLIPIIVFFAVGATALIVGLLGSDRAVAKIWGTKRH